MSAQRRAKKQSRLRQSSLKSMARCKLSSQIAYAHANRLVVWFYAAAHIVCLDEQLCCVDVGMSSSVDHLQTRIVHICAGNVASVAMLSKSSCVNVGSILVLSNVQCRKYFGAVRLFDVHCQNFFCNFVKMLLCSLQLLSSPKVRIVFTAVNDC